MMAKLPDLSELTKKVDVQKIVTDIKSLINPGKTTPEAPEGNELAEKMAELIGIVNQIADTHAEQAKEIAKVSNQLHELYNYAVSQSQQEESAASETSTQSQQDNQGETTSQQQTPSKEDQGAEEQSQSHQSTTKSGSKQQQKQQQDEGPSKDEDKTS